MWISFLSRCQSVLFRCSTNKKFRDITNIYKWMWKRECYLHSLLCMSSRLEMSFSRYKVQDTRRKIITDLKMNYNSQKDLHAPGTLKYYTCSRKINWEWTFGKRRRESAFQAWADFCKSFFISLLLEIIGR